MAVEELESLLGREDSEVDFRRILEEARNKKGRAIFETSSSEGPSELLVVSRPRWDEHQRMLSEQKEEPRITPLKLRQNSFSSTSGRQWQADLEEQRGTWEQSRKKGGCCNGRLLGKVHRYKRGGCGFQLLLEPEEAEVCLRYILKHAKRRGSIIFEIFDTEKNDHLVASWMRWLEHKEKREALQERWQNDWQDIKYEGIMAEAPPCPERSMRTPLPQQSSSSNREEESQWSCGR